MSAQKDLVTLHFVATSEAYVGSARFDLYKRLSNILPEELQHSIQFLEEFESDKSNTTGIMEFGNSKIPGHKYPSMIMPTEFHSMKVEVVLHNHDVVTAYVEFYLNADIPQPQNEEANKDVDFLQYDDYPAQQFRLRVRSLAVEWMKDNLSGSFSREFGAANHPVMEIWQSLACDMVPSTKLVPGSRGDFSVERVEGVPLVEGVTLDSQKHIRSKPGIDYGRLQNILKNKTPHGFLFPGSAFYGGIDNSFHSEILVIVRRRAISNPSQKIYCAPPPPFVEHYKSNHKAIKDGMIRWTFAKLVHEYGRHISRLSLEVSRSSSMKDDDILSMLRQEVGKSFIFDFVNLCNFLDRLLEKDGHAVVNIVNPHYRYEPFVFTETLKTMRQHVEGLRLQTNELYSMLNASTSIQQQNTAIEEQRKSIKISWISLGAASVLSISAIAVSLITANWAPVIDFLKAVLHL